MAEAEVEAQYGAFVSIKKKSGKPPPYLDVAALYGVVQGGPVLVALTAEAVDVGPVLDEDSDHRQLAVVAGLVEGGPAWIKKNSGLI